MNKAKILTLLVLLLIFMFCANLFLFSQEVSEKKDIAIFKLSYYDWSIPNEALGTVDARIRQVIVDLGRFNVIGITQRMGARDVNVFIDKIKSMKEETVDIPEEVAMGHVILTEADLNQLIGSFIVIIPAVTNFDVKVQRDDDNNFTGYKASLTTSFSVLNVETMILEKEIIIETSGFDSENRNDAIIESISDITNMLTFEIKKIPIFTLKTGILEVYKGGLTLELGKNMGIRPGYEFTIIREYVLKSGHKREKEVGLFLVNSVSEEVSEATTLYGEPQEGDQLKEIPRMGFEGNIYGHLINSFDGGSYTTVGFDFGLKATLSMNVYALRPFVLLELPFLINPSIEDEFIQTLSFAYGFPFGAYIGGEWTMYMGRLQISPSVALGLGGLYPWDETDDPALTHGGGKAFVSLSYLLTRDFKLAVDLGYKYWAGISPFPTIQGIIAGAGITWKM